MAVPADLPRPAAGDARADAGVVDEDVEARHRGDHGGRERAHFFEGGEVRAVAPRLAGPRAGGAFPWLMEPRV
ncbi:MAG TPA: hypothetical protein VGM06_04535 [Polyangiaceae bacterium]